MCENEEGGRGWSIFYSIQDNEMKRCQGLTLDKVNQVDKKLSQMSHVIVNDFQVSLFFFRLSAYYLNTK